MFLLFIGTMAISLFATWRVRNAYSKYSQVPASSGMTGAEIAQRILDLSGIRDVMIESQPGTLTDHYDPSRKTLVLSEGNYHGSSVASLGVSAHECGHAIQHQQLYAPLQWRMAAVGITGIASKTIYWGSILGMFGGLFPFKLMITIMALSFGVLMLFQLITLPVEFDATARAKRILAETGALAPGAETDGMNRVLDAAAMTYVAAFITTLVHFAWHVMRMMDNRR